MHPKIDSVTVTTMFTCSVCDKIKTGLVNRVLNAKPEFPAGAEAVDLLICGVCASAFTREEDDDSEEQYQNFQKREAQARAAERTRFLKRLLIDPLQFQG